MREVKPTHGEPVLLVSKLLLELRVHHRRCPMLVFPRGRLWRRQTVEQYLDHISGPEMNQSTSKLPNEVGKVRSIRLLGTGAAQVIAHQHTVSPQVHHALFQEGPIRQSCRETGINYLNRPHIYLVVQMGCTFEAMSTPGMAPS